MEKTFIPLHKGEIVAYICMLILLLYGGSVANILVIYAIKTKKKLQSSHNILIQQLCISNLIICIFTSISTLIILVLHLHCISVAGICFVRHVTIFVSLFANFLFVTTLSLEKHDNIVNPFKKTFTKSRARLSKVIAIIWVIVSVAGIVISVEYWKGSPGKCFNVLNSGSTKLYYVLNMTAFGIMSVISLYCYIRIILVLKRHSKVVRKQTIRRKRLERQPLKIVAVFILTCLVIWFPAGMLRIGRAFADQKIVFDHLYVFSAILLCFPSFSHPLTCIILGSRVHEQIRAILGRRKTRKSQVGQPAESSISVIT